MISTKITVLLSLVFFIFTLLDWTKSTSHYLVKKVLDCLFNICAYISITLLSKDMSVSKVQPISKILYSIAIIVIFISFIFLFVFEAKLFFKIKTSPRSIYITAILNIFLIVLMAFSSINYLIYFLFPPSYLIPVGLSFPEVCFEFVYYTFNLMITFGETSICATSVLAKTMQMLEIAFFYIAIGICISGLINRMHGQEQNLS